MIPGWTTQPVDGRLLDAPLPVPHRTVYRDGEIVTPVPGAASLVEVSAGGGDAEVRAGLDAEGRPALVATVTVREVFHAVLIDRTEVDFRIKACDPPPATEWAACEPGEEP